mgnify:CR=1 FL=1|jgi:hypothetical protein
MRGFGQELSELYWLFCLDDEEPAEGNKGARGLSRTERGETGLGARAYLHIVRSGLPCPFDPGRAV